MTLSEISNIRLQSQHITSPKSGSVKDIVGWMGAMQAQDFPMSKWAVGARLSGSNEQMIEDAIGTGEIIRTHLLRPTWHLVSADDIYSLLELTSPYIKRSLKPRQQELELSNPLLIKCYELFQRILEGENHKTREEIVAELKNSGINTNDNRASHIFMHAEMEGVICSGALKQNKITYALLPERVKKTISLTHEESLANIAKKYFSSHFPATIQDFIWWSGLPVRDARNALEMVKSDFIPVKLAEETYWIDKSFSGIIQNESSAYLLPAYDEFLISYKDRSASLPATINKKAVSDNGVFRPVIVLDGQIIGLWKRTQKKDRLVVETEFFKQPSKKTILQVEKASQKLGAYFGKRIELSHKK